MLLHEENTILSLLLYTLVRISSPTKNYSKGNDRKIKKLCMYSIKLSCSSTIISARKHGPLGKLNAKRESYIELESFNINLYGNKFSALREKGG